TSAAQSSTHGTAAYVEQERGGLSGQHRTSGGRIDRGVRKALSGGTSHPGGAAPPRRRLFADCPVRSIRLRKVDDATMPGRPGQAGARNHPFRRRNLVRRRAWYFSSATASPDRLPVPG